MNENIRSPRLSKSINTDGFRGWHEYELARSFGYLGLGLIALIAALSILENFFDTPSVAGKLFKAFPSFCALCFAAWSWQRFITTLIFAENLSKQAVCIGCGRYAQLTIIEERVCPADHAGVLTCRCKKCAAEWDMAYALESHHEHS